MTRKQPSSTSMRTTPGRGDQLAHGLIVRGRADRPRSADMTGRNDYSAADWPAVRAEAARAHNERTASYLLGMPLLGDFLDEGLSMLGHSCDEFEIGRL